MPIRTICNGGSDASQVVEGVPHERIRGRCAVKEQARSRNGARAIVVGILAAVAMSYGEYRAIEWAPAAKGAYLIGLSSDFRQVLDSRNAAAPGGGCASRR
ncbi:MAG TPA: hypothetical protein VEN29_00545 [Casimicrobiaceae bacterium]|nr:hypothetical protein [Casimicrobiaceae bacterium]